MILVIFTHWILVVFSQWNFPLGGWEARGERDSGLQVFIYPTPSLLDQGRGNNHIPISGHNSFRATLSPPWCQNSQSHPPMGEMAPCSCWSLGVWPPLIHHQPFTFSPQSHCQDQMILLRWFLNRHLLKNQIPENQVPLGRSHIEQGKIQLERSFC